MLLPVEVYLPHQLGRRWTAVLQRDGFDVECLHSASARISCGARCYRLAIRPADSGAWLALTTVAHRPTFLRLEQCLVASGGQYSDWSALTTDARVLGRLPLHATGDLSASLRRQSFAAELSQATSFCAGEQGQRFAVIKLRHSGMRCTVTQGPAMDPETGADQLFVDFRFEFGLWRSVFAPKSISSFIHSCGVALHEAGGTVLLAPGRPLTRASSTANRPSNADS